MRDFWRLCWGVRAAGRYFHGKVETKGETREKRILRGSWKKSGEGRESSRLAYDFGQGRGTVRQRWVTGKASMKTRLMALHMYNRGWESTKRDRKMDKG